MTFESMIDDAARLLPEIVDLRRALHRNPEIGLRLPGTKALVLEALAGLPLKIVEHVETSGIVAVLEGPEPGPTVLLRGDMDGLPMTEDTGLEYASVTGDTMHACGHDMHTAMLVGAARMLSARRESLSGSVVFMFQPGEEGYHGARYMIEEGLLEVTGERPVIGLAIHVTTIVETGKLAVRSGAMMASADQLEVRIVGAGGHASRPDGANDPVAIAAEIITAIQTAVTRKISVFDPAVCTITSIDAGSAHNIIPERVVLRGTIRAVSAGTRARMHELVAQVVDGVCAAHGAAAEVRIENGYPVTVNDPAATAELLLAAQSLVGSSRIVNLANPSMGGEDWSYVLEHVPGAMFFLGACPPDQTPDTAPYNHSNIVRFDEEAMVTGMAFYSAAALQRLQ